MIMSADADADEDDDEGELDSHLRRDRGRLFILDFRFLSRLTSVIKFLVIATHECPT